MEEDYAVLPGTSPGQPPMLQARQARIKGSAAGMEPPDDAVLQNGWYVYTPNQQPLPELLLMRSEFTALTTGAPSGAASRCQI